VIALVSKQNKSLISYLPKFDSTFYCAFINGSLDLNIASTFLSLEGIYDTLSQCSLVSKAAGGIGLSVSNIRAKGSYIKGTKGTSNGLVPMLRVFDATAR
jgi:hypothetical protein